MTTTVYRPTVSATGDSSITGDVDITGDLDVTGSLTVDSAGNTILAVTGGASSGAELNLGDTADSNICRFAYDNSANSLNIIVNTVSAIFTNSSRNVGVGATSLAAKLHVDQSGGSGAIPVLLLDQADVSEEFIRFVGQSTTDASWSLVDAVNLTTPGSIVGWVKIYIEDLQGTDPITDGLYYIPFYTAPTA